MNYEELKKGCLFHASSNMNLQEIKPLPADAYENKTLVFAARHPVIAAMFLHDIGKGITCNIEGIVGDVPVLEEKYKGAFEVKYPEEPGAIYIVPAKDFFWARTHYRHPKSPEKERWAEDYVSPFTIQPIEKIIIPNVRAYINQLIGKKLIDYKPHEQGKTLEDRLSEIYPPGSPQYEENYQLLSSPEYIKAEIQRRQQIR